MVADCFGQWVMARKNADAEVDKLTQKLLEESAEERSRIVLIGHSLGGGGRIVVKTLAKLAKKNKTINRAVVMGAAIDAADSAIGFAPAGTQNGVENRINPKDHVLTKFYGSVGEIKIKDLSKDRTVESQQKSIKDKISLKSSKALGVLDATGFKPKWRDVVVENNSLDNHFFENYWRAACCGK